MNNSKARAREREKVFLHEKQIERIDKNNKDSDVSQNEELTDSFGMNGQRFKERKSYI